jgi:hypothetical protein
MPDDMNRNVGGSMNPAALTAENVARLLSRVGGQPVTVAMLEADRLAGAPRNVDGTVNLVHYAAWLVKEMGRRAE